MLKSRKPPKEKEQNLKSIMEAQWVIMALITVLTLISEDFARANQKVSDAIGRQWNGNLNDLQSADEAAAICRIQIWLRLSRIQVRVAMEVEFLKIERLCG